MAADLEGQGSATAQYGAIDALKGGAKQSGVPEGESGRLFRVIAGTYVAFFSINFVCDFIYLITMDGRFPHAMGQDGIAYPSEAERQATVSYTQHMTVIGMMGSMTRFSVLAAILYYGLFAKADAALHHTFSALNQKRISYYEWCVSTWLGGHLASLCALLWIPFAWCGNLLLRCGTCCCGPCQRGLADHDWRKLLHGSVYVALFATFFVLLSTPFSFMALELELEYGFANALSITKSMFWAGMVGRVINTLIWSIPSTFFFLAVLQFKYGWLFMWVCTTALMTFVQYNMATLAPILMGINNVFPDDTFAVGRGFPLAATDSRVTPWISLNRIYFREGDSQVEFSTNDQSKGILSLKRDEGKGSWTIADKYYHPAASYQAPKVYAQVLAPTAPSNQMLNVLNETPWPDLHHTGHVGVRLGDKLRSKLFGFAHDVNVSISEIYLIDGSHKDARANAFAGGAKDSIIGLYDTLFLGDHARDTAAADRRTTAFQKMESGESAIQFLSTEVQGTDTDVEDDVNAGTWASAPTQAMSDDEIVAILGHELAHAALGHLQETTWRQAAVTFFTFAAMGWAAHSPLLAAAFVMPAPVLHVGYCVYQYVLGPPLNRVVKFVSDARIRHNEYEADAFVAKMSPRYGTALQTGLAKLSVNTNQDPDAPFWYEALHHDHPTVSHRFAHIEQVMAEEEKKRRHG